MSDPLSVSSMSLADYDALWSSPGAEWLSRSPFVTPPWLSAWWEVFGEGREALLLKVTRGDALLGVAPLMCDGATASVMGSSDLCDHGDFLVAPGQEEAFGEALLGELPRLGVKSLEMASVRPDSVALKRLLPVAREAGCEVEVAPSGASLEMRLPGSWEAYLESLNGKQRHEARRKLRRVADEGEVVCRPVRSPQEAAAAVERFLDFFCQSREDKADFLNPRREAFFRRLVEGLAQAGMLNMLAIDIGQEQAAAVFCVDLGETTYLYNNGFDPRYRAASLGAVSKLLSIKASIESGRAVYDFLGGTERYKYRLGGQEVVLSRCSIRLG